MEEGEVEYFFDSYAVIEILNRNPNYEFYRNKEITLTIYNLAEIYYSCIGNFNEEELNEIYSEYKEAVVDISEDILKKAMKFRKEHKKKDFSYADAIGYIYAKQNNLKFLTGDNGFENLENVDFVK